MIDVLTFTPPQKWIVSQLGAREHYSIPLALHHAQALAAFVTDVWLVPGLLQRRFPIPRWRERTSPDLPAELVHAFPLQALGFETLCRSARIAGWPLMIARNDWFQSRVEALLNRRRPEADVFFSYSYTARRPFAWARNGGLTTVLGQIDPGPREEQIVSELHKQLGEIAGDWHPAPTSYWDRWREETSLADRIVVNSPWSRDALIQEGICSNKIEVIPVAFNPPTEAANFERRYPSAFSASRPMRVLFLGQANVRKGMHLLLEAMGRLQTPTIEFLIVGPVSITVPQKLKTQPNIRWEGSVPRSRAAEYYRYADLFILPTFSDGFAITQLEAQAWKLPVIASRFCGEVVENGQNGIVLNSLSAESIEAALLRLLHNPLELVEMANKSRVDKRFTLTAIAESLLAANCSLPCLNR